jgi:large conductance mechanosensitive channel
VEAHMLKEFKEFALKGNLVELAMAFILGLAFATLVQSLVANIFTPIIAAIFGKPDFSSLSFTINKSTFTYG